MLRNRLVIFGFVLTLATAAGRANAQGRPDAAALIAAQKTAMAPLSYMDGVWRGPASTTRPSGEKHDITQTERIGPFLEGSVKVMEGRGYDADGKVTFNAFGTISYNPDKKAYSMHSYAMGSSGDFPLTPNATGFVWVIPAGPEATIRYTATVKDGKWNEVGDFMGKDKPPVRFFEMNLVRVGSTDWPAGGAISAK
ncbi:MAG: DUF1579 domain-containing protein [Thermoanaerobaculia bacterium]